MEKADPIERKSDNRMTFDYEDSLVFYAQKYIISQLARKAAKEMAGLIWGNKSLDLDPDEYGLIVNKDKKRIAFTFTRAELIEGYGSSEWKARLLDKIDKILKRTER